MTAGSSVDAPLRSRSSAVLLPRDGRLTLFLRCFRNVQVIAKDQAYVINDGTRMDSPVIEAKSAVVDNVAEVEKNRGIHRHIPIPSLCSRVSERRCSGESTSLSRPPEHGLPKPSPPRRQRPSFSESVSSGALRATACASTMSWSGFEAPVFSSTAGPLMWCSMQAAEERKTARLKAVGFNAIRSPRSPKSTAMLDACEKLGMLIMESSICAPPARATWTTRFHRQVVTRR